MNVSTYTIERVEHIENKNRANALKNEKVRLEIGTELEHPPAIPFGVHLQRKSKRNQLSRGGGGGGINVELLIR